MKQLREWVLSTAVAALVLGCAEPPSREPSDPSAGSDSSATMPAGVSSAPTPSVQDTVLTADGWRDLRIGMSRADVVAAAGEDANPDAVGGPDPATCDEFRPSRAPAGLLVMIRGGRLTRISITEGADVVTGEGIGIGDSVSLVRQAYGAEATSSPHAFHAAPAEYLAVWRVGPPSPSARGLVYEISGGRVLRILAGDESIEYREGCV